MDDCSQNSDFVRRFGSNVSTRSGNSLELLRAIDDVISWLGGLTKHAEGDIEYAHQFLTLFKEDAFDSEVDPDDILVGNLSLAISAISKIIERLIVKRESAKRDQELIGENKENLVDEFETAIDKFQLLCISIDDLRKAVIAHDRQFTELIGPFDTVDELLAALKA